MKEECLICSAPLEYLTQILRESKNVVFFGGAGMSTESGVPDFRSANGIYSQRLHQEFRPEDKNIVRAGFRKQEYNANQKTEALESGSISLCLFLSVYFPCLFFSSCILRIMGLIPPFCKIPII